MIKIEKIETEGWEAAIRGMRNPLNSWEKSDSRLFDYYCEGEQVYHDIFYNDYYGDSDGEIDFEKGLYLGPNDMNLMMRLAKSGTEHAKYRRMINVTMDITAPLYWWKEFDTYKVGTVANSCSTMHTIHKKPFELDDFSHDQLLNMDDIHEDLIVNYDLDLDELKRDFENYLLGVNNDAPLVAEGDGSIVYSPEGVFELIIRMLNVCRALYLKTKDKKYWWQMIQLLPSSYNQKRTVQMNYEVLANIYRQRRNHKLDEWHGFCDLIERLPYSQIITLEEEKMGKSIKKEEADMRGDSNG